MPEINLSTQFKSLDEMLSTINALKENPIVTTIQGSIVVRKEENRDSFTLSWTESRPAVDTTPAPAI